MRKPNYFGTCLSRLRLNGFLLAGFLGGVAGAKATPAPDQPRKKEQTLNGSKTLDVKESSVPAELPVDSEESK